MSNNNIYSLFEQGWTFKYSFIFGSSQMLIILILDRVIFLYNFEITQTFIKYLKKQIK